MGALFKICSVASTLEISLISDAETNRIDPNSNYLLTERSFKSDSGPLLSTQSPEQLLPVLDLGEEGGEEG